MEDSEGRQLGTPENKSTKGFLLFFRESHSTPSAFLKRDKCGKESTRCLSSKLRRIIRLLLTLAWKPDCLHRPVLPCQNNKSHQLIFGNRVFCCLYRPALHETLRSNVSCSGCSCLRGYSGYMKTGLPRLPDT